MTADMENELQAYADMENDLQAYNDAQRYLKLSKVYAEYLGGLRWSGTEDAIIYGDGRCFAFNEAIAEFVDGFAGQGRLVPFGYLLHWIDLLQNHRGIAKADRLRAISVETGSNWRNAGAFAATQSDVLPDDLGLTTPGHIVSRLRNRAFPIRWFTSQFHESGTFLEQPAIAPEAFESEVLDRIERFTEDELRAWLRTGRGPIRGSERIAAELPVPRSLVGKLAKLLERPRLAGADAYVAQLVGALALPPRRFLPEELPIGGYTDIVTKGQVEHLVPTQFALDEMEFLRRYSERELLYFRREEPPARHRQELVVLLDQGVRTWGDVRLVLAAGTLAYAKHAANARTPFGLAATSSGGTFVDLAAIDSDALGKMIEASDLSLNPGLALERVLETPCDAMRDIVLLTHTRNVSEDDVLAAARRLNKGDRLFAVGLDGHGQAELVEIRHGAAIHVRRFRIQFVSSVPPPVRDVSALWTGPVESIPYAFRISTDSKITHFDFDYDNQWLLTVSGHGYLQLWKLDGSTQEMLPRVAVPMLAKQILCVQGVKGGFVLVCRKGNGIGAIHYDINSRLCECHDLGPSDLASVRICYLPESHSVAVQNEERMAEAYLIDLPNKKVYSSAKGVLPAKSPVRWMRNIAEFQVHRNRSLPFSKDKVAARTIGVKASCFFESWSGRIAVQNGHLQPTYSPIANGERCFINATPLNVQYAGNTLAIRAMRRDIGESISLIDCTLGRSEGAIIREYQLGTGKHKILDFLLSFDGQSIALLRSENRVEVVSARDIVRPHYQTGTGKIASDLRFFVGENCLLLNHGPTDAPSHWHLFDWDNGTLQHQYTRERFRPNHPRALQAMPMVDVHVTRKQFPACALADPERFRSGVRYHDLWYVLDRFGQVAVLDADEQVIAMFTAFRNLIGVCMPDGTRFGTVMRNLGPQTAGAAEKIGRTLVRRIDDLRGSP